MATEDDLKAARSEFNEAFAKASLRSAASQLSQIQVMTLDDLDEAPLHEQIVILDDAAAKFRDIADGRTDPEELPLPPFGQD